MNRFHGSSPSKGLLQLLVLVFFVSVLLSIFGQTDLPPSRSTNANMKADAQSNSSRTSKQLTAILERAGPDIETIRKLFDAPSFAVGLISRGERAFKGFGYANIEKSQQPDENTIYGVGSCTKGFTSTVLSRLAHDGHLDLDAPVSTTLTDLNTVSNPQVSDQMTTRDMLAHNAGLNQLIYEVVGRDGDVFAMRDNIIQIFNHLPKVSDFRGEWQYNNWLFALAGVLITHLSKMTFGATVKREVFSKLHMDRSYFTYPTDENFALPYQIFGNRNPEAKDLPAFGDGDAFDSSGSMRSCVKDMLTWADSLMYVWRDSHPKRPTLLAWMLSWLTPGIDRRGQQIPGELHRAMTTIQEPYFPLADDPKQNYAMGLYTWHLPTPQINVVTNYGLFKSDYVVGRDSPEKVVVGHTGDYGGFLSVYWTFPEDDAAIVVLCNSYEINGDPTNIVAQLLMQDMFTMKPAIDMVQVAKGVVENGKKRWDDVVHDWKAHRDVGNASDSISMDVFAGTYTNTGLNMTLEFSAVHRNDVHNSKPSLQMAINGLDGQEFALYQYHHSTWTFLPESRDDCIAKGYAAYISSWECFNLDFVPSRDGSYQEVRWRLDPDERVEQTSFVRL